MTKPVSPTEPSLESTADPTKNAEFDAFAANYDDALNQGLAVSGESKEFFAEGRMKWLAKRIQQLGETPRSALDFGCGTGTATPYLFSHLQVGRVTGVDVSEGSLDEARRDYGSERATFAPIVSNSPPGPFDIAFCSGVFHHIPLAERVASVRYVLEALRPGGLFAFCENNPWNPGTRYIMSKIPFDRDAITLTPPESRKLMNENGFEILSCDFLFFFPGPLGFLRSLEPSLRGVPMGAQYMILCRKPKAA